MIERLKNLILKNTYMNKKEEDTYFSILFFSFTYLVVKYSEVLTKKDLTVFSSNANLASPSSSLQ